MESILPEHWSFGSVTLLGWCHWTFFLCRMDANTLMVDRKWVLDVLFAGEGWFTLVLFVSPS